MFERFTDRSRRVLVFAQEEARLFDHSYIGTEHILLGLIREEDGIAAQALKQCGVSLEAARDEVRGNVKTPSRTGSDSPSFAQPAIMVLEKAAREAAQLGHDSVGTEFLLIGLIREIGRDHVLRGSITNDEGAARVLQKLDVDLESLLTRVLALMVGSTESEGTD
jgi:ATP-dependent Clp protease ATP-binding subunit ClpC